MNELLNILLCWRQYLYYLSMTVRCFIENITYSCIISSSTKKKKLERAECWWMRSIYAQYRQTWASVTLFTQNTAHQQGMSKPIEASGNSQHQSTGVQHSPFLKEALTFLLCFTESICIDWNCSLLQLAHLCLRWGKWFYFSTFLRQFLWIAKTIDF